MINDIITDLQRNFNITSNSSKTAKLAMYAFAKAMEDYILWKVSPQGKAFFKAHPIKRKDILNRLKQRRLIMAWVAVDKNGDEYVWGDKPRRMGNSFWIHYQLIEQLPSGSIEKLINRKLTWEDEPVELK